MVEVDNNEVASRWVTDQVVSGDAINAGQVGPNGLFPCFYDFMIRTSEDCYHPDLYEYKY